MNKIKFIIFNLILAIFTTNNSIYAQSIIRFNSGEEWKDALGSSSFINIEDFNSFNTDIDFGNSSLNTGKLIISDKFRFPPILDEIPPFNDNDISLDVFPYKDAATGIDNTPIINLNINRQEFVEFKLPGDFSAFGLDYEIYSPSSIIFDNTTNADLTVIINEVTRIVVTFDAYPPRKGFFGFIISDKIDRFNIVYNTPSDDVFIALDNIVWANSTSITSTTVTEPNTIFSLLSLSLLIPLRLVLNLKK